MESVIKTVMQHNKASSKHMLKLQTVTSLLLTISQAYDILPVSDST